MKLGTEWEGFQAVPDEYVDGGDTIVALRPLQQYVQEDGQKHARADGARVEDQGRESLRVPAAYGHGARTARIGGYGADECGIARRCLTSLDSRSSRSAASLIAYFRWGLPIFDGMPLGLPADVFGGRMSRQYE